MTLQNNRSGKVLTIFLVIIGILLITLTALSMFFYNVEIDRRKTAESNVATIEKEFEKVKAELKEIEKKNFLLDEKNKEADARINSLLDEIELEKGLREEIKKETLVFKEQIEKLKKEKGDLNSQISTKLGDYEQKIMELEAKLKVELNRNKELIQQNEELETLRKKVDELSKQAASAANQAAATRAAAASAVRQANARMAQRGSDDADIKLGEIVVTQPSDQEGDDLVAQIVGEPVGGDANGRILSVDVETEFVVINLGEKDGVQKGMFMSVYRGDNYLGDIKITRTQAEMAAADFIPPLTSGQVRKNDQVISK